MTRWHALRIMDVARGNQTIAGRNRFRWEEFDALPRVLRDILNFAPVELGSGRAYDALLAGSDLRSVAAQEVRLARDFARQHVLMTYGPTHPEAQSREPRSESVA